MEEMAYRSVLYVERGCIFEGNGYEKNKLLLPLLFLLICFPLQHVMNPHPPKATLPGTC